MMLKSHKSKIINHEWRSGFSLTEVLLAVGTLAVGMLFIAGVFPVSIYFTTVASERTIAVNVADEAFAKIKLYGLLPSSDANWIALGFQTQPFEFVAAIRPPEYEFGYPSNTADSSQKYWWSAVCRRLGANDVQVTVFVSRKVGTATMYNAPLPDPDSIRPRALSVGISGVTGNYEIMITGTKTRINDGYTIVDDATGQIYRVLERYKPPNDTTIRLDKPWQGGGNAVWVVPQPTGTGGGRYPCIAVYQKVMRF
jgi:Tfp pilus assembly protein PilV